MTRLGEESAFVNGVRLLTFREVPDVDIFGGWPGALKTDDTALVCELAEPTPFKRSPCKDSLSSAWGADASGAGGMLSPPPREEPPSSTREFDAAAFVSAAGRMLCESMLNDFDFSRSFALSLAARGAEGKNCAKLAPGARDIVAQDSIYLTLGLPTIISEPVSSVRLHPSRQWRRWPVRATMREEIHAPPGRDVLRCAVTADEGPEVVAKGEVLMVAAVLTRCSREEEGSGCGGGG